MADTWGGHRKATLMDGATCGTIQSIPRRLRHLLLRSLIALMTCGCATAAVNNVPSPASPQPAALNRDRFAPPLREAKPKRRPTIGYASWYGPGLEGHKTASGERFSSGRMTAAAKGIPLGSQVVVTNLSNGRSAKVRINDCGPLRRGRKLDLSKRAARKIGIIHGGIARVKITVITAPRGGAVCEL